MCGRYYVDDETAREIEKLVRDLDRKLQIERTGDVFPSQKATIIKGQGNYLTAEQMRWGFPGFEKGKLLINARAESALERRTFQDSVQHRRCIIPARGFYEWSKSKEKFSLSFRRIILIRQICCVYYPQLSKNAQNIRNPVPF